MSAQLSPNAWEHRAACRGPQSAVFFPPPQFERKRDRLERESKAKAICNVCPVKAQCLQHSLTIGEAHGIWGGLNEAERKALLVPTV